MAEENYLYGVLMGKPEVMKPLGRLRRRWEGCIKMNLRDVELRYGQYRSGSR
jgi:hypothetical protein